LEQLVKKGYLTSSLTDPLPERGGRSKRIYAITPLGQKALHAIKRLENIMWDAVSETDGA
jgi:DNA-binding PadR family transcriptional regulator